MTRYVSRAELIEFMKEIDSEYGIPGSVEHAERNADEFIRRFFGVEPFPEPVHPQIIDLDTLQSEPLSDFVALFVEHAPQLGQARGEVRVVKLDEEET